MKLCSLLWLAGCLLAAHAATISFDDAPLGQLPRGWRTSITGQGEPKWAVIEDSSTPAHGKILEQSGITPKASFPVCWYNGALIQNGWVETKFKAIRGEIDQAGGVIWRVTDEKNYYVCRANALENNVVLYKVEAGKRQALQLIGRSTGYGVPEKVVAGQWHTLRVEFDGARFKVSFNGKPLFEVEDATFAEAGSVGLWTKADSVTLFDEFGFGVKPE